MPHQVSNDRVKAMVDFAQEKLRRSLRLFAGAVVSPAAAAAAAAARGGEEAPLLPPCPFCGHDHGTLDHVMWRCQCPAIRAVRPPGGPRDALQARLFWPTGIKQRAGLDRAIWNYGMMMDHVILQTRHAGVTPEEAIASYRAPWHGGAAPGGAGAGSSNGQAPA